MVLSFTQMRGIKCSGIGLPCFARFFLLLIVCFVEVLGIASHCVVKHFAGQLQSLHDRLRRDVCLSGFQMLTDLRDGHALERVLRCVGHGWGLGLISRFVQLIEIQGQGRICRRRERKSWKRKRETRKASIWHVSHT
ncbi:hypothetical protein QBC37DRAFT_431700 [Rhypophila decipiens]|uniref:Uncharacterized protein n=1 Tax=Rhypophila decipiens TaxID=261697 RepID=A0AAN6XXA1_9PEZI|nr:hypothetical protein QBC37DRAFT_431700 [Rhypophila decipiens]